MSLGSVSRVLPIPGLSEYGLGFKSLADAIDLRNRVILHLETAEAMEDPEERREFLTFIFVGAGYAGLEGIAELQDYVADMLDHYPRCRMDGTRWILVEATGPGHARDPRQPGPVRHARAARPRHRDPDRTRLDGSGSAAPRCRPARRCRPGSCAGPRASSRPAMVRELGLPLDEHGRIQAEDTTRVPGHDNVWAIGDVAAVPDPANKGKPSPPTAQHVIRQGSVVADNVAATLSGGKLRKFRYRTLGVFVDMGQHKAVATMLGVRLRGFPAWFAARTYHVAAMPGNSRRLRIVLDWTVGLLFGRASAQLGNLGHPTSLAEYSEDNPRGGERPGEPQGVD